MKKPFHLVVACVALGLAVSACGSGQDSGNGNPAAVNQQSGEGGAAGGGPGGGFPGGSGKVAAVTGSTAQVQGQGGQVAVTWTSRTTFTQQVTASAKDLKVGDCVAAMPAASSSSSPDTSSVAAASVRISTPVDGSCTGSVRGGGPRTDQGTPPEGAPSGAPSDGGVRRMMGAFGKVTAISGTGFTVESSRPGSTDTSKISVATSGDTTWTTSAKATAKDVKVGSCVASLGRSDSTGAITAASIAVSQPVNGECAMVMGRDAAGPGGSGQQGEAQNS